MSLLNIRFICEFCNEISEEPGAILISPPNSDDSYDKYHMCGKCFSIMLGLRRGTEQ